MKNIDPVVAHILNEALDSKDISVEQAVELFDTSGLEISAITMVADMLRKCSVGDVVNIRREQKHQLH